jgi:hypothetical protein
MLIYVSVAWAEAVFWAERPLVLVEVHRFGCTSPVAGDAVLYHCGKECSCPFDLYRPLLGVILSKASPIYSEETQLLTSSRLGLRRVVS